jgi:hypothetical protein
MILLAVITFWLLVLSYIPFHFRKTYFFKDTATGFKEFWYVILYARLPEPFDSDTSESFKTGVILGMCSLGAACLIVLCFAIWTIYYSWNL